MATTPSRKRVADGASTPPEEAATPGLFSRLFSSHKKKKARVLTISSDLGLLPSPQPLAKSSPLPKLQLQLQSASKDAPASTTNAIDTYTATDTAVSFVLPSRTRRSRTYYKPNSQILIPLPHKQTAITAASLMDIQALLHQNKGSLFPEQPTTEPPPAALRLGTRLLGTNQTGRRINPAAVAKPAAEPQQTRKTVTFHASPDAKNATNNTPLPSKVRFQQRVATPATKMTPATSTPISTPSTTTTTNSSSSNMMSPPFSTLVSNFVPHDEYSIHGEYDFGSVDVAPLAPLTHTMVYTLPDTGGGSADIDLSASYKLQPLITLEPRDPNKVTIQPVRYSLDTDGNDEEKHAAAAKKSRVGSEPLTWASLPAMTKLFEGKWKCPTCLAYNDIGTNSACLACEGPRPNMGTTATKSATATDIPAFTFGNSNAKSTAPFSIKVTTDAKAPGAGTDINAAMQPAPFSFGTTTASKEATTAPFSFGVTPTTTEAMVPVKASFSFGVKTEKISVETPAKFPITLEAQTEPKRKVKRSFAEEEAPRTTDRKPPAAAEAFTFGAFHGSTLTPQENAPTFKFGVSEGSTTTPNKSTPIVTFGASNGVMKTPAASNETPPTFTFGAASASTTTPAAIKETVPAQAATPSFTFGVSSGSPPAPATSKVSATSSFTFGAPSSGSTMTPAPAAPPASATPSFTFGAPNSGSTITLAPAAPQASATPSFTFGAPNSGSTMTPAPAALQASATPSFTFGVPNSGSTMTPAPAVSQASLTPSFTFGAPNSGSTMNLAPTAPQTSGTPSLTFGAPHSGAARTPAAPTSAFVFGASSESTNPSTRVSNGGLAFGSVASAPHFGATATAAFGGGGLGSQPPFSAPSPVPPYAITSFGPAPGAQGFGAAPGGFGGSSFVGAPSAAAPATPSFGFGGTPAPAASINFGGFSGTPASGFGGTWQPNAPAASGSFSTPQTGGFSIGSGGPSKSTGGKRRIIRAKRPTPGGSGV